MTDFFRGPFMVPSYSCKHKLGLASQSLGSHVAEWKPQAIDHVVSGLGCRGFYVWPDGAHMDTYI